MNREASMLEWKRLLVDGAHWRAQKKFKSHNKKGKGGHLGCSEGFNWNLYKHTVDEKVNSQGREQMHSLIEKCTESLRLMSYSNFMIFMKGREHNICLSFKFILLLPSSDPLTFPLRLTPSTFLVY